jgi:TRAP-type C4-dicarboxylate transport system permease small subunit
MPGWLETYRKIIDTASNICNVIGQVFAGIMIVLVAADAIGRYVFNHPIQGALEISEVISRLPRKIQPYIEFLDVVISFGIIGIIAWQSVLYSLELREAGSISAYWGIPISPFLLVVAFGCLLFCFQLLLKLLSLVHQARSAN